MSNHVEIEDERGSVMKFRRGNGFNQFEVTDNLELRLLNGDPTDSKPLNIFGIGLGYSVKTSNAFVGAEKTLNTRADGVKLYHTVVAEVLLSNLSARRKPKNPLKRACSPINKLSII